MDQKVIDMAVGRDHVRHHVLVHHILYQQPGIARHAHLFPLLDQNLGNHFGAQYIVRGQLLITIQVRDANLQVFQLPTGFVQNGQRQPGRENFLLDHLIANQLEVARIKLLSPAVGGRDQCSPPRRRGVCHPDFAQSLELQHGIAPVLHLAGARAGVDQLDHPATNAIAQGHHHALGMGNEQLSRFAGQFSSRGCRCGHSMAFRLRRLR
jgi:hypothetical protein